MPNTQNTNLPTALTMVLTEQLPNGIRQEAELTITDEFYWNCEGELVWDFRQVFVKRVAEEIIESREYDEEFLNYVEKLSRNIKKNGLKKPVVFGPGGLEGNHRVVACHLAGIKKIPAWVGRVETRPRKMELIGQMRELHAKAQRTARARKSGETKKAAV